MSAASLTFVLVHGSWHDGTTFKDVIAHLEAAGHRAYAPTLAGHGPGVDRKVTHDDCVNSVVDFIAGEGLSNVVLMGHSFAGTVIAKVAERIPSTLRRLIFWNAFVLNDGESLLDNVPPHYRDLFSQLAAAAPDNSVMMPFPVWREAFMNDADLALAESSYALLTPEPFAPFTARLDLKVFHSLSIPRSYLNCLEDTALPPGEWAWHPRMSSRLGLYRLVQMRGGHEVVFTNPAGLALALIDAGRD